jgi:signal transduction histidine kinase
VFGHAKLIKKASPGDAAIADGAAVIMDQCQRMSSIVRQVLDYAKRRSPNKVCSDLRDLVSQCVNLLRPLAQERQVSVETDFGGSVFALVDAVQIQQAITNMVMNAVQASPPGERVSVRLRIDQGSIEASDPKATITVEDFGSGMEQDTLKHIFEPFFSTKPASQGTGLGLSIAKGIIEEHGGSIRVTSVPGTGSRFEIELPVAT